MVIVWRFIITTIYVYILYIYIHIHIIYIYMKYICEIEAQDLSAMIQRNTNFFLRKVLGLLILNPAKTVWVLWIFSQKSARNFQMKELWALENHTLVNMLYCSSYITKVHLSIHWYIAQRFKPTFSMSVLLRRSSLF